MDLPQKYTEGKILFYELEETVVIDIDNMPNKVGFRIINILEDNIIELQGVDNQSQILGGVVNDIEDYYFALKFIYEVNGYPYFFQFYEITSDEYLDLYNQNKIFKQ